MTKIPFLTMQKLHKEVVETGKDLEEAKDFFYVKDKKKRKQNAHPHDMALKVQTTRRAVNTQAKELRSKFVVINNPNFKEKEETDA